MSTADFMMPIGPGMVFNLDVGTTTLISGGLIETFHFQENHSSRNKFWTYIILPREGKTPKEHYIGQNIL